MSTVVFYGAGKEARKRLCDLEAKGLVPTCFSDADPEKHYTQITASGGGGSAYDILPLDVVKECFPDYVLYLTLAIKNFRSVTNWLIEKGVPADRIKYAEPVEWRWGCESLGQFLHIWRNSVNDCCVPQHAGVKIEGRNAYENFGIVRKKSLKGFVKVTLGIAQDVRRCAKIFGRLVLSNIKSVSVRICLAIDAASNVGTAMYQKSEA